MSYHITEPAHCYAHVIKWQNVLEGVPALGVSSEQLVLCRWLVPVPCACRPGGLASPKAIKRLVLFAKETDPLSG